MTQKDETGSDDVTHALGEITGNLDVIAGRLDAIAVKLAKLAGKLRGRDRGRNGASTL